MSSAWPVSIFSVPPPVTPWPRISPPSDRRPFASVGDAAESATSVTLPPLPPFCLPLASSAAPDDTSIRLPCPIVTPCVDSRRTVPPSMTASVAESSGAVPMSTRRPRRSSVTPSRTVSDESASFASTRGWAPATGDVKTLPASSVPPRTVTSAPMSMNAPSRFMRPPSASVSAFSTVTLPRVPMSSTDRCCAFRCAASSHSVLMRSAASASAAAICCVIGATSPKRTSVSNRSMRPCAP
ncbi:hypothetical protein D9M68_403120 [compost metagenome]